MEFKPVDLDVHIELCIKFRRDTHLLSYGEKVQFNVAESIRWFTSLKENNANGFEHVIFDNKIIGQLEYRSGIIDSRGALAGYINLLYLSPEYRSKGYGLLLQKHIFSRFKLDSCSTAYLRYMPQNKIAGLFYVKNGWRAIGTPNQNGQLMINDLND